MPGPQGPGSLCAPRILAAEGGLSDPWHRAQALQGRRLWRRRWPVAMGTTSAVGFWFEDALEGNELTPPARW